MRHLETDPAAFAAAVQVITAYITTRKTETRGAIVHVRRGQRRGVCGVYRRRQRICAAGRCCRCLPRSSQSLVFP